MKHKLQYTEIGQFYTGILMYCDACTRKKYDLPPKTNTSFPKLDGAQRWSWNWDSHWNEIWKPVETNTIQHFPKLDGLSQPSSSVFGRFQTLCEEKNTQKPIQKWIQMYGRANLSKNATFKHLSLIWGPLKIPHHGERGCGSRLSIWWWLLLYLFWPSK